MQLYISIMQWIKKRVSTKKYLLVYLFVLPLFQQVRHLIIFGREKQLIMLLLINKDHDSHNFWWSSSFIYYLLGFFFCMKNALKLQLMQVITNFNPCSISWEAGQNHFSVRLLSKFYNFYREGKISL
jgi:hypothetical protein